MESRKLSGIILLILTILSSPIPHAQANSKTLPESQPVYLIRETIEMTSDWLSMAWHDGPLIIKSRYQVLEGTDAPNFMFINGLDAWFGKDSMDPTKVVIQIEALALEGTLTSWTNIGKGGDRVRELAPRGLRPKCRSF
ncbi:hypothetical protein HOC87_02840 [Candidatus Bathyarchaeota archaeon]|jgi:hypothetical protein|nr:hypothetical protein [Candidatus Bathyarchaeota archaeon]